MGITFALRGDSLDARYSNSGKTGASISVNNPATVSSDATSINGSDSISFDASGYTRHGHVWPGYKNITTTKDISVLARVKFGTVTSQQVLFALGGSNKDPFSQIELWLDTSSNLRGVMYNDDQSRGLNSTTFSATVGTSDWHDIFLTWDNSTRTMQVFEDASSLGSAVSTRQFSTAWSYLVMTQILIGSGDLGNACQFDLDEFVIWDEIIDPTNITLTSGSGSLNGSSRSAYVDVASFDGTASTGGNNDVVAGGIQI